MVSVLITEKLSFQQHIMFHHFLDTNRLFTLAFNMADFDMNEFKLYSRARRISYYADTVFKWI